MAEATKVSSDDENDHASDSDSDDDEPTKVSALFEKIKLIFSIAPVGNFGEVAGVFSH